MMWLIGLVTVAVTLWWCHSHNLPLWPFNRQVTTSAEILLRYEIVLLACLGYATWRSGRRWLNLILLARRDARRIEELIAARRWDQAALLIHRYCLAVSATWRRLPRRVAQWDDAVRPHMPRHRRLYVYFRDQRPTLPPDACASFSPEVITPPSPSLWTAALLVPIGLLLYSLIIDLVKTGYQQRAVQFNAILIAVVLVVYGGYFLSMLMGHSSYIRLAPGVMQLIRYQMSARRPRIETFDLTQGGAMLDLSSRWPALTLVATPGYRSQTFLLPRDRDAIEATLRACLSTAPKLPLSDDELLD